MALKIFNTLSGEKDEFVPLTPGRVRMYVCGVTVYDSAHLGHCRFLITFDVIYRYLRFLGFDVTYVRNFTDVDDKIIKRSNEEQVSWETITQRYIGEFHQDGEALGLFAPSVEPLATQHIAEIIDIIEQLEAKELAYRIDGDVYYSVAGFPSYGKLSRKNIDELEAGARVEVDERKRSPLDFALWKSSKPGEPTWDSPWGPGRPGWHIECSAMSAAHLGETIDIHAGGNDLLFPHHENEVAQSTCAHGGKIFARWWLHNGMLTFGGRKMSKSLGNTLVLHELLQQHSPELLRFMLMKAHYRQPLDWSETTIQQARATLDGLYGTLRDLAAVPVAANECNFPAEVATALADDLNTPEALAALARLAEKARKATNPQEKKAAKAALFGAGAFLGLLQQDPETWFKHAATGIQIDTAWVERLLGERANARKRRDFTSADRIRDELAEKGVVIEDGPQGVRWKLAHAGADHDECTA